MVGLFAFALLVAGARAFQMQVLKAQRFRALSRSNYLRRIPVPAIRGRILDRNGKVLAGWEPVFVGVALMGKKGLDQRQLRALKKVLGKDSLHVKPNYLGYSVVADDIPPEKAWAVLEQKERFDWLMIMPWFKRTYPNAKTLGHVVGYVDAEGVGKAGLEKSQDLELSGINGREYIMVDAKGQVVGTDIYPQEEPEPGKDITLTIDLDLQNAADSLFRPYQKGAVVVLNIKTGGVLVMYSKPYVDPNIMVYGTPQQKADALSAPGSPLLNRAVAGRYPPGSTFKPVIAMVGLQSGSIDPNTVFCCYGGVRLGNQFFGCTGAHGCLTVLHGIEKSCNSFFYNVGMRMGLPLLLEWLNRMDFLTRKYDLGVGGEKKCLIPNMAYYMKRYGRFFPGTALNLSIGQGELLLTPLHMAIEAGLVAAGRMPAPHLIKKIGSSEYQVSDTLALPVSEDNRQLVKLGMKLVVDNGTARSCRLPGFSFGGKTGTAQNPHGRDHSLFIFYAPYDDPEICGAVVVENGGYGASAAAPVARELIRRYFDLPPAPLFITHKPDTSEPEMPEIIVPEEP